MLPIVALAVFDFMSTRRVHKVTLICSALMTIAFLRVLLIESRSGCRLAAASCCGRSLIVSYSISTGSSSSPFSVPPFSGSVAPDDAFLRRGRMS